MLQGILGLVVFGNRGEVVAPRTGQFLLRLQVLEHRAQAGVTPLPGEPRSLVGRLERLAGQFNLHKVYKPGDPYNPARFGDLAAYKEKIANAKHNYEKQLAEERQTAYR